MNAALILVPLLVATPLPARKTPTVAPVGKSSLYVSGTDVNGILDALPVNLRNYGAVCDGATDDKAAVVAALAAIGSPKTTLVIPGSCFLGSDVSIPSNVVLRYEGAGFVGPGKATIAGGTPTSILTQPSDLEIHHLIRPVRPAAQAPTWYPMGNDLLLQVGGSADLWLQTVPAETSSATAVEVPGAVTITVGSTASLCPPAAACGITVAPGTADEEIIAHTAWSVVDGTHISATFSKAHAQPFSVRQEGSVIFGTERLVVRPTDESGSVLRLQDRNLFDILTIPNDVTGAWPGTALTFDRYITGNFVGSDGDFRLRMYATTGRFLYVDAAGNKELLALDDDGNLSAFAAVSAPVVRAEAFSMTTGNHLRLQGSVQVDGSIRSFFGGNSDLAGSLTMSEAGSSTFTFAESYLVAPHCVCSDSTAVQPCRASATVTALTVYGTAGDAVNYICIGKGD